MTHDEQFSVEDSRFVSDAPASPSLGSGARRGESSPDRPANRRVPAALRAAGAGRRGERSRGAGTFLGVVFLAAFAIGLVAMAALVMPDIVYLAAVVLGCFIFGWLHYLLWGRWLSRMRPPDGGPSDEDPER